MGRASEPSAHQGDPSTSKLWGGRFTREADASIEAFTRSLPFDQGMAVHDIRGSIAHCRMLGRCGIIPPEEAAQIEAGLERVLAEVVEGARIEGAEDIHTWVEHRLRKHVGTVAGKLHTARSRNDQVATDTRLYLRDGAAELDGLLAALQEVLLRRAEEHGETVLPGYTHLQHAQPLLLAHHLLCYFWMLERDRDRLADWRRRANRLPLGAGALAGTPYPVDREFVAAELGFDGVIPNSMDAVSDRDFVVELAAALALLMAHFSRLGEEIVLWSSREFSFVELDDSVATGSSIMPQKKNPDVAELVRGKAGRTYGNLVSLLTMMKGIPLTYDSDMQEDKERIFDSLDTAAGCARALTTLLATARFRTEQMRAATEGDFSTATDLADYLVQRGRPFREAHEVVGRIVRWCEGRGHALEGVTPAELAAFAPEFGDAPDGVASVDASVRARAAFGGTAPDMVREQLALAKAAWERRNW
jgi:argininosuccinate lyase